MPHNFDILNMDPRLGFVEQKLATNMFLGSFINCSAYIIHRSFLPTLVSRVKPLFGMELDVALHNNSRQVGIYPQIFKQKGYSSDISPGSETPSTLRQFGFDLLHSSSLIGWLYMEGAYVFRTVCVAVDDSHEFKDRRVKNDKFKLKEQDL